MNRNANTDFYPLMKFIEKDLGARFQQESDGNFYLQAPAKKIMVIHEHSFNEKDQLLDEKIRIAKPGIFDSHFDIEKCSQPNICFLSFEIKDFIQTFSGISQFRSSNRVLTDFEIEFIDGLKMELENKASKAREEEKMKAATKSTSGIAFVAKLPYFDLVLVLDVFNYVYNRFKGEDPGTGSKYLLDRGQ